MVSVIQTRYIQRLSKFHWCPHDQHLCQTSVLRNAQQGQGSPATGNYCKQFGVEMQIDLAARREA